MKIIEKIEEPLLSRTKIIVDVEFNGATISKKDLEKQISQKLKVDEKLIVTKKISTIYGHRKGIATLYLYKGEEDKNRIEPKVKVAKKTE